MIWVTIGFVGGGRIEGWGPYRRQLGLRLEGPLGEGHREADGRERLAPDQGWPWVGLFQPLGGGRFAVVVLVLFRYTPLQGEALDRHPGDVVPEVRGGEARPAHVVVGLDAPRDLAGRGGPGRQGRRVLCQQP